MTCPLAADQGSTKIVKISQLTCFFPKIRQNWNLGGFEIFKNQPHRGFQKSYLIEKYILEFKMSFIPKRFCFCCRQTSEELEAKNKTLKFCKDCQVAQYCDKECQRIDFLDYHKQVCAKMIKTTKVKLAEIELGSNVKGFDVNERKLNLVKLKNPAVDELFMKHLQFADYTIRCIIEMSRTHESYHGMELGLRKYLELMMTLQPAFLHLR